MSFTAALGFGDGPGLPVNEFIRLTKVITAKYGKGVMVSEVDKDGHMHLSKDETGAVTGFEYHRHLGYIDINTGSLIWERVA